MTLALIKMAGSNWKLLFTYWIQNFSSRYVQFYYGTCSFIICTHSSTPDVTHTLQVKFKLKIFMPKPYTKFISTLFPNEQSPKQKKARKMQLWMKQASSINQKNCSRSTSCQYGRVVKAIDLKSIGVPPRRFEPCCWRTFKNCFCAFATPLRRLILTVFAASQSLV